MNNEITNNENDDKSSQDVRKLNDVIIRVINESENLNLYRRISVANS